MELNITKELIFKKIDEYLMLIQRAGLVTDRFLLNEYSKNLHSLNIIEVPIFPGDAMIDYDSLYYSPTNITYQMMFYGEYYLDEVLFHEFSHLINSFHQALIGPYYYEISTAIEEKMDPFTNGELLKQEDSLLYNQDPCFGVVLLDEYVAQNVAQIIIKNKYNYMNQKEKKRYSSNELNFFNKREYITNLTEPPYKMTTSLADYPEYDELAQSFIKKYLGITSFEFIKRSINGDLLSNIISNLDYEEAEDLYVDLCYLGLIEEAYSINRGIETKSDSKDPANNPKSVYKALIKVLKKDS